MHCRAAVPFPPRVDMFYMLQPLLRCLEHPDRTLTFMKDAIIRFDVCYDMCSCKIVSGVYNLEA
jgi:hypothetical protein